MDLEKDIRGRMGFPLVVSPGLKSMTI
jgi:hypothetical protein